MAFKGTWHRGDGAGSATGGDRRYTSSNDSYSSFALPPQGTSSSQMGLPPMNYQNNPNTMYPVMNSVRMKQINQHVCLHCEHLTHAHLFTGPWNDGIKQLFVSK
jgi:hypothetical protein